MKKFKVLSKQLAKLDNLKMIQIEDIHQFELNQKCFINNSFI
mgnify:CR=1 FL=1